MSRLPEMPACDDVSCQLWQLINIYKSATKRIRANDRSARAFMRERMNLRTNVTGNEIHLFPISGRNRENKMTELEGCADSCLREDVSKIILIMNIAYDEE